MSEIGVKISELPLGSTIAISVVEVATNNGGLISVALPAGMFASDARTSVKSRVVITPPVSPLEGDRYLCGASSTGAWLGKDGMVAEFLKNAESVGAWYFSTANGILYVQDEEIVYVAVNGVLSTAPVVSQAQLDAVAATIAAASLGITPFATKADLLADTTHTGFAQVWDDPTAAFNRQYFRASTGDAWASATNVADLALAAAAAAQTTADEALAEADTLAVQVSVIPGAAAAAIRDSAGNSLVEFTQENIRHPNITRIQGEIDGLNIDISVTPGAASCAIRDSAGNLLVNFTPTKITHPEIDLLYENYSNTSDLIANNFAKGQRNATWDAIQICSQIVHIIWYGQSLSLGHSGVPPISTTPLTGGLRFVGGVRVQDGGGSVAANHGSLVPLIETQHTDPNDGDQDGETGTYGCVQMLLQLFASENGIDVSALGQQFLVSAPGLSGTSLANLSLGTAPFTRLKDDVTYGRTRGDGLGLTYDLGAMALMQGEEDYAINTAPATWGTELTQLRLDAQTWKQSQAGVTTTLPCFLYQTSTHIYYGRSTPGIALEQLLFDADANFCMATPTYFFPYADVVHLTAQGYKWMGAYFGLAIKRWLVDGIKPVAMAPTRVEVMGNALVATFPVDQGRHLVWDTTTVPAQTNMGFTMSTAGGTPITITDVEIVGANKVVIWTATARSAGDLLNYAWTGDASKGLGNLRDNQGDFIVFDPTGLNLPLHRWPPIFSKGAV